jgi:hypothetical protein
MSYYLVKVNFETGEVKQNGDAIVKKVEFLVSGDSVIEVETKVAQYLDGTVGAFETTQISKTKIEAVVGNENVEN